jgi:hypothetical protein
MGPFSSEQDALAAAPPLPEDPRDWAVFSEELITGACVEAGVGLGAYDELIIRWLAHFPPAACAVVAGMITRAHEG